MIKPETGSIAVVDRIETLDLLRGVAICGILLMNIPLMGMLAHVGHPPYPAALTPDWAASFVQHVLFAGSMRGLFTLLFGAGMLVMLRRTERDGAAAPMDVFVRRCIALMFLGIVQFAIFLWPGEILFDYGLTGFFILAFRTSAPRRLWTIALVLMALFSFSGLGQVYSIQSQIDAAAKARIVQAQHRPLTKEQRDAIEQDDKQRADRNPTPAMVAKEIKQRTHYPSVLGWSAGFWAESNLGSFSWFGPLESFIFMLIGMALFRTGLLAGERPLGTYARLALFGYGIGFPVRAIGTMWQMKAGLEFDFAAAAYNTVLYEPARLLVTLGHVGCLCWLFKAGALGRAWPARALGRMALTTYSLQSILTSILFYGFGLLNRFGFATLMLICVAIWIVTGLFAVLWLRVYAQGPAEWLLRRMAYGRHAAAPNAMPGPDGTPATA